MIRYFHHFVSMGPSVLFVKISFLTERDAKPNVIFGFTKRQTDDVDRLQERCLYFLYGFSIIGPGENQVLFLWHSLKSLPSDTDAFRLLIL